MPKPESQTTPEALQKSFEKARKGRGPFGLELQTTPRPLREVRKDFDNFWLYNFESRRPNWWLAHISRENPDRVVFGGQYAHVELFDDCPVIGLLEPPTPQPPIDNRFVAKGCEQFGEKHD